MLSLDRGGVTPLTLSGDRGDLMLESLSLSDMLLRELLGLELSVLGVSALEPGLEPFFLGDK